MFLYIVYIQQSTSYSISSLRASRLRRLLCHDYALNCTVISSLRALSISSCSPLLFDATTVSARIWQMILELRSDVHVVAVCEFLEHIFHGELARVGAIGLVNVLSKSNWCNGINEILIILILICSECLVVLLED